MLLGPLCLVSQILVIFYEQDIERLLCCLFLLNRSDLLEEDDVQWFVLLILFQYVMYSSKVGLMILWMSDHTRRDSKNLT